MIPKTIRLYTNFIISKIINLIIRTQTTKQIKYKKILNNLPTSEKTGSGRKLEEHILGKLLTKSMCFLRLTECASCI